MPRFQYFKFLGRGLLRNNFIALYCSFFFYLWFCIQSDEGYIQGVPGGKVNILGGHNIGYSKQKCLYEHVSYSERFPR